MQNHVFSIAQACKGAGITHVVICPGSRSAPLVRAFGGDKHFSCFSVVDERSAAYMALGMARNLGKPVVLICTSGTASLNFFPAIAEAFYQKVPLLVLTADRPPELLNQQDGQMIMQKNVYGTHVLSSFEIPCYQPGKENHQETTSIVKRALRCGFFEGSGPVHINVPLSEPLYGNNRIEAVAGNGVKLHKKELLPPPISEMAKAVHAWQSGSKKLILIGQYPSDNALFTQLLQLSNQPDVVILADVLSNQQVVNTATHFDFILSHSTADVLKQLQPDSLISFGGPVLSKALKEWLKKQKPGFHLRINSGKHAVDTYQNVTNEVNANPVEVLRELNRHTKPHETHSWKQLWVKVNELASARVNTFLNKSGFNELTATAAILKQLPDACELHIGNSSVIRYVSYTGELKPSVIASGNRGTSGIDGCTSTAVGAALVNNKLTVLLTGDLAFFYDRNALWNRHIPPNLKIVVINNNGGGIFTLINGPSEQPELLPYFTTPHRQSMKLTALQSEMDYYFCDSLKTLDHQLSRFLDPLSGAAVLEIKTDISKNASAFKLFKNIKLI